MKNAALALVEVLRRVEVYDDGGSSTAGVSRTAKSGRLTLLSHHVGGLVEICG